MNKLTKALLAGLIGLSAVVAAPIAAGAAPYTPNVPAPVQSVHGLSVSFSFPAGTFAPHSPVTGSIVGPGTASASFLADAAGLALGTSSSTGALATALTFSAAGTYTLTAVDAEGNSATVTVSVGSTSASTTSSASTSSGTGLATTGSYVSLATLWGAVGLVALGGGFVATRKLVRRSDAKHD